MQLLFKLNDGIDEARAVAGDSNFKDHFPYIQQNTSWRSLAVEIKKVTRDMIIPYIGRDFYDALVERWNTDTLNEGEAELVELLQDSIAEYTIWKRSSGMKLTQGDMGALVPTTKDGTAHSPSPWEYKHYFWKVMLDADKHLDDVLRLLENNDFTDFNRESILYGNYKTLLCHTDDFQRYEHIHNSRRTFLALLPTLRYVESGLRDDYIGHETFWGLVERVGTLNETEADKELREKLEPVIAAKTLHNALPKLSIKVEGDGLMVVTSVDGMNTKQTAQLARMQELREALERSYKEGIQKLENFLYANRDNYPAWKEEFYEEDDGESGYPLDFGDGAVFLS